MSYTTSIIKQEAGSQSREVGSREVRSSWLGINISLKKWKQAKQVGGYGGCLSQSLPAHCVTGALRQRKWWWTG